MNQINISKRTIINCLIALTLVFCYAGCNNDDETDVPATGITASAEALTLEIKQAEALTATIAPANATIQRYSWESSNKSVADVNNAGLVTGLAKGTANIVVKTPRDGYTDTVKVTVLGPVVVVPEIAGTYTGIVTMNGAAVGADIPLELKYTSETTVSIDTRATIMGGIMTLHVHGDALSVTLTDDVYTVSGDAITDNFGYGDKKTTVNGTVDASGKIYLHIVVDSISEKVEYNGQKK
ncbi:MAG: Ig-like domain-containing protein [Dysgonamonadaceae bacterium]|jgi:hypothetical protein|nr:Ig-like domain-containing protein [Dysgonamonadaceae bacterium]